ncbi:MAG: hypothetical protein CM15mP49_20590 [Actinomycetota bacterium]|nr:MAG: hypothetical protein CM15mP49_20590 [Actinomycetota bacterium]
MPIAIRACPKSFLANLKIKGFINFTTAQITVAPRMALGNSESSDASGSKDKTIAPVIAPDQEFQLQLPYSKNFFRKSPPTGNEFETADAILATP